MSHHADASHQDAGTWLPLTEYAVRSGVSLSTIRRKIKSNSIPFRLEKGRYLILFRVGETLDSNEHAETVAAVAPMPRPEPKLMSVPAAATPVFTAPAAAPASANMDQAVRMISEAFEHTLREKDERIRLLEKRNEDLEERLNELRTLVRVLEEKYEVRY